MAGFAGEDGKVIDREALLGIDFEFEVLKGSGQHSGLVCNGSTCVRSCSRHLTLVPSGPLRRSKDIQGSQGRQCVQS